jgi:hypothetical protein
MSPKSEFAAARQHLWRSVLSLGAAIVLPSLGLAVLAGCGGDDKETSARAGGFDGPYCVTARKWAAHELNGDGDVQYARGGPAALKTYWNDYIAYTKASAQQAPPVIHEAAAIKERAISRLTPLLEKYGFDPKRAEAEASASEKARTQLNPKEQRAQAVTHAYDDRICQYGGEPPAAKVTFKRSAAAKPYCKAVATQEAGFEKVVSSNADPEVHRSYVTSDSFSRVLDAQDATAPSEIAADVKAVNDWNRDRKLPLLEDYDYDLRRLLREGSAEDLSVNTYWHPAIRKHESRVTAYQEQVCGA